MRAQLHRKQRGIAAVEAAIVLPFLIFVMLAASEFSHAFVQHMTLTKAARDGVRYLAEEAIDGTRQVNITPQLADETRRLVMYGDPNETSGTPLVTGLQMNDISVIDAGGNNVEVRVNYSHSGIIGSVLPAFGYGSDISLLLSLQASVTMRAL